MPSAQKTPLSRALSAAIRAGSLEEIGKLGLTLPGHVVSVSGIMVTAAFDVHTLPPYAPGQPPPKPVASLPLVTIPLATSSYVRLPIQPGDVGLAVPASVLLAAIYGQPGAATPVLGGLVPNMSAMFWLPIGSQGFSPVDGSLLVMYGPLGVQILGAPPPAGLIGPQIKVAATSITLSVGSSSIVITSTGVTIMGEDFITHDHGPGSYNIPDVGSVVGDSGPVVG